MKKSLVVLLIAVLALSAVFAADVAITVEGDVSASYVFDFDKTKGTYNVPSLNGALAWELVLPVAKAGSEYPYIDVAGEIDVDLANVAYYLTPEVDFSTFAIVGEDWNVNFLASIGTLDYAVSAIDTKWYCPTNAYGHQSGRWVPAALTYRWQSAAYYNDAVAISKEGIGTLTFVGTTAKAVDYDDTKTGSACYASTETVAVFNVMEEAERYMGKLAGSNSNPFVFYDMEEDEVKGLWKVMKYTAYTPATTVFAVEGESDELKLADSISTQFGFGFAKKDVEYSKNAESTKKKNTDDHVKSVSEYIASKNGEFMNAGFSTKTSYEDIYTVAADFGYTFKTSSTPASFYADVASSFKYEMVSVDVYYANGPLSYYNEKDLAAINADTYYTTILDTKGKPVIYNLLSAKASVEVEEIGTTFTFTGKDLLASAKNLSYKAVNTYFDNYTFTFNASTKLNNTVSVGFKAEADYAAEVGVTAYAGVTANPVNKTKAYIPAVLFKTGIAYAKDGFSFSVDFCSDAYEDAATLITLDNGETYSDETIKSHWDNDFANKKFSFTVKAGYEAETFKLSSAVEYNTHEKSAKSYRNWVVCPGLYVSAGIESDKLVDGATLSLDYESGELLESHPVNGRYGAVTAAVTVEF